MGILKVLIVDAGHGGMLAGEYQTAGKRSPVWPDGTQYFEGVGNRQIAAKIIQILEAANVDLKIFETAKVQEDVSLERRVAIVNEIVGVHGKENCLLLSIHSNGHTAEGAHGFEVWSSKGVTASDAYAEELHEEMKKIFPAERFRGVKESNFYVLKHSKCAAILSENFFHTNKRECQQILMNDEAQTKLAIAHTEMILKHCKHEI